MKGKGTELSKHPTTMDVALNHRPSSTEADSPRDLHEPQDVVARPATPPPNPFAFSVSSSAVAPWSPSRGNPLFPTENPPEGPGLSAYSYDSTCSSETMPPAEGDNVLPPLWAVPDYPPEKDMDLPPIHELLASTSLPKPSIAKSAIAPPLSLPPRRGDGTPDPVTRSVFPAVTPSTPAPSEHYHGVEPNYPHRPDIVLPPIHDLLTSASMPPYAIADPATTSPVSLLLRPTISRIPPVPGSTAHPARGGVVRGPSPDITPSLAPFTDSGYASSKGGLLDQVKGGANIASREQAINSELVLSRATAAEGSLSIPDNTDEAEYSASVVESTSVYTSNSSVASELKDAYTEALVDELLESVLDCLVGPENVEQISEQISEALPELLKNFALSIGFCPPGPMHRNVMVFIHKYREWVLNCNFHPV